MYEREENTMVFMMMAFREIHEVEVGPPKERSSAKELSDRTA